MSKVLITGGCGFIGSAIARRLVSEGYAVRVIDNLYRNDTSNIQDLIDKGSVEFVEGDIRYQAKVMSVCDDVEYIFHEAADCINKSLKNPTESFDTNVLGTTNVFEAAKLTGVKKVIYASSASVYGDPDELPMREDGPLKPITPYCISKVTVERIADFYARYHGVDSIGFRYFNVYGPRQNVDAFYTNVVILFLKRIMNGDAPVIKGDGKQSMDFIHVDDIARANIMALESDVRNEVFNLGTNKSTTIAELARILLEACGKPDLKPEFTGETFMVKERRASVEKAKDMLGWEPEIDVEEGLKELAKDIINNPRKYQ